VARLILEQDAQERPVDRESEHSSSQLLASDVYPLFKAYNSGRLRKNGSSMQVVSDPAHLDFAWKDQYQRVANYLGKFLPSAKYKLVEVGCGRGQFTIPVAKLNPDYRIIAVDNFAGPYSKSLKALKRTLKKERLSERITVIVSDYLDWLSRQPESRYDGVISSEFLCETDSKEMKTFFSQSCRISKPRSLTMHSFLSPQARNQEQRLVIEANLDPRWAKYPPKEWFSPVPKLVASYLKKAGFVSTRILGVKSNLRIVGEAAYKTLLDWNVKAAFGRKYKQRLVSRGLEIPDWIIVLGRKPN